MGPYGRPYSVQVHIGVIVHSFLKMACNLETAGRRAKWIEIWDLGALMDHMVGTFDFVLQGRFGGYSVHFTKWLSEPYKGHLILTF